MAESMASKTRIARMIASSVVGTSAAAGKGESPGSVFQGEGITFDTSDNFREVSTSAAGEAHEPIARSSEGLRVGSVSFSGKFENCHFHFGKDVTH